MRMRGAGLCNGQCHGGEVALASSKIGGGGKSIDSEWYPSLIPPLMNFTNTPVVIFQVASFTVVQFPKWPHWGRYKLRMEEKISCGPGVHGMGRKHPTTKGDNAAGIRRRRPHYFSTLSSESSLLFAFSS